MDRTTGARMQNLFQQLEKVGGKSAKNQTSGEDLQQIRYVTLKIFQLLSTQGSEQVGDKIHRDLILKSQGQLELLLLTMKNSVDTAVVLNILHTLIEFIGKTQVGKRVSALNNANASNIVLMTMVRESEEQSVCEEILLCAHQVLAKLAQKDRKFATKARLSRALLVTLGLIKSNINQFRNLQIFLQVFKQYTNNSVNSSYLGKHNSIPPMFKVIQQCGRKHTSVLKLALEILVNLTKSRLCFTGNNAARTIGGEHVPHLLGLYNDWHQMDTKHRHVGIRKGILNILKNITNLRSGRKSLADANGIQILYDSAQEVIDCREMESLILLASVIMRKCCPRNKLPLSEIRSALSYDLPESDLYPESTRQEGMLGYGSLQEGQDSDNSSLEDDDDIDSDDERFKTDQSEEAIEEQDLRVEPDQSIYIPTGGDDSYQNVVTDSNFPHQYSSQGLITNSSGLYRVSSNAASFSSKTSSYDSMPYEVAEYLDSYSSLRCDSATAINLKTGTSVFSLDLPVASSGGKPVRKQSSQPKNQNGKKSKGSKKSQKDKKSKKSNNGSGSQSSYTRSDNFEADFSESLCITPVPMASRDFDDYDIRGSSSSDEDDIDCLHDPLLYQDLAGRTISAYRFDKLAYPDLFGAKSCPNAENLYRRKFGVQRAKVFEDIDRMIHPENVIDHDVYDLDATVKLAGSAYKSQNSSLTNRDHLRIGSRLDAVGANSLRFNAQFESGNLRKVVWVGMKPVMFSVMEAMEGRPYWTRVGTDICYYKNHFARSPQATGGVKGKTYFTATFTVKFKHNKDVCYMAYHYPYTYTTLQTHLLAWERICDHTQIFFRRQKLCNTISGNSVPVLTITAQPKNFSKEAVEELKSRPYVFLSARVHPGESNASWVMKGSIDYLLSKRQSAKVLRESYIFKIVPMLNPDGVINGNHRCSLAAEDLNRRWDNPCPKLHPTIYHTKGLLQYMQMINKTPYLYCDYHGHSRRKNIFIYGCSPTLPRLLHVISPTFSWPNCSFVVEKAKETTARVVVWRQIGVVRSYTMESTYCGLDRDGKFKDQHISTGMLVDMGHKFCEGLLRMRSRSPASDNVASFPSGYGTQSTEQIGATSRSYRGKICYVLVYYTCISKLMWFKKISDLFCILNVMLFLLTLFLNPLERKLKYVTKDLLYSLFHFIK
ncbi:hypothetical protein KUTeg_018264, partial [Tegillarca granosa]